MFHPNKNSYLQLVCAINPRIINKAVDQAMLNVELDAHTEHPPAQRLESMQPSLYAPHVDITRARMGFERIGLKLLVRNLHSVDNLIQVQALHSIMDQVHIVENALYLIQLRVVHRLMDLLHNRNPVMREKVCIVFSTLATYIQGINQILSRPQIIYNLVWLCLRDRKEIRYAAAHTLKALSRERCACEVLILTEDIIENLLKMVKNDHVGIVLLHLKTLENLIEWDQEKPLKHNAFQVMLTLFDHADTRIVCGSMDCMAQLLKHEIGMQLGDKYDLTYVLRPFLFSENIEVIISSVSLMKVTTLTTRSKWRAKQCINSLSQRLVHLCYSPNKPLLQINAMQVLINLCDCPDVRYHLKQHWEKRIIGIKVRTHEEWDGTSETTSYGLETGHNYRTMCIEKLETIHNDYGDNASCVNVHSYLRTVLEVKQRLIKAINWKCYRD